LRFTLNESDALTIPTPLFFGRKTATRRGVVTRKLTTAINLSSIYLIAKKGYFFVNAFQLTRPTSRPKITFVPGGTTFVRQSEFGSA
jgi:hypothetical protein